MNTHTHTHTAVPNISPPNRLAKANMQLIAHTNNSVFRALVDSSSFGTSGLVSRSLGLQLPPCKLLGLRFSVGG